MTDHTRAASTPDVGAHLTSIDDLDDAYLARQDDMEAAIEAGDQDAALSAGRAARALRALDADGRLWCVKGPLPEAESKPHYRYRYLHQRSDDGERFWNADRHRFADHPSLASVYASQIDGGWLRGAVRGAEPAGYVATGMVGLGLWLLLGDLIGSLPGLAVVAMMVAAAAGLWWISIAIGDVPFREAARLSQLTRVAAVGVSGAIAWVATIDMDSMSTAARILIAAVVVLVAAVASFVTRPGADTWGIAVVGWVVAGIAAAVVIAEAAHATPDEAASARLGALVATAVGVPLATRTARPAWVPIGVPFFALVAGWSVFGAMVDDAGDLHTMLVALGGSAAAAVTFLAGNLLPGGLRLVHRICAYAVAGMTVLLALTNGPWETIFDWLGRVPFPVVLVVGGSAVLIAVGLVVRSAVNRLTD